MTYQPLQSEDVVLKTVACATEDECEWHPWCKAGCQKAAKGEQVGATSIPGATELPPLPPLDAGHMLPYSLIRYVAGYPESYVQAYATAYARAALASPLAEDARDAARYRWLRDPTNADGPNLVASSSPEELDAAIDAAMPLPEGPVLKQETEG